MSAAIDITDNVLRFNESIDSLSTIAGWVNSGYASGAWNGPGINSSTAAAEVADHNSRTIGYADNSQWSSIPSGEVEVRYTLIGDVNLDGSVGYTDYVTAVNNRNLNAGYGGGDVLDQGTVDTLDLDAIVNDYGNSLDAITGL